MHFLLTVKILDGEHEHLSHAIIEAKSEQDARLWSDAIIIHNDDGFDHEGSVFGFGDEMTITSFLSLREISGEFSRHIERLFHVVKALSKDDAIAWIRGSMFYNDEGVDHPDSRFGWWGSGSSTNFSSIIQISGEVARHFERLNVIENNFTVNDEVLALARERAGENDRPTYEILQAILMEEATMG